MILKTCSLDNTASMCLDACAGFKGDVDLDGAGTSDGYTYRYYILGEKSSADMCTQ
eukprot:SAG31_NODE_7828_length_1588_cov_1.454668_1_plen_56_part_00